MWHLACLHVTSGSGCYHKVLGHADVVPPLQHCSTTIAAITKGPLNLWQHKYRFTSIAVDIASVEAGYRRGQGRRTQSSGEQTRFRWLRSTGAVTLLGPYQRRGLQTKLGQRLNILVTAFTIHPSVNQSMLVMNVKVSRSAALRHEVPSGT